MEGVVDAFAFVEGVIGASTLVEGMLSASTLVEGVPSVFALVEGVRPPPETSKNQFLKPFLEHWQNLSNLAHFKSVSSFCGQGAHCSFYPCGGCD